MGRHTATQDPLHVLYIGSSADLGALRRLMEAHGAVTRARLTPEVAVVVVDHSVPTNHPTILAAGSLGIPVMDHGEAIAQYASWRTRTKPTEPARRHWPFRDPRRDRRGS